MKQVHVLVVLACLIVAAVVSAQLKGELPLTNPGFEAGDVSGWNMWPGDDPKVSIVTDMVSEGSNAAKISGGTGAVYKMVTDEAEMIPGKFYCVVAKVLNPSAEPLADGQSIYLAGKAMTPDGDVWFNSHRVVTFEDGPDVWYELSVGVNYPENATAFNAEFKWTGTGSDDPGCVYVDDVKVVHMQTPEEFTNTGFEDPEDTMFGGDGGWWTWSYLPVDPVVGEEAWIDDTISRSGDRSLAIIPQDWYSWSDDWWWGGFYSWSGYTLYDSENYYLAGDCFYMSGWVMTPSADKFEGVGDVALELTFKDVDGTNTSNLGYANGRVWSPSMLTEESAADEWHFLEMFIQSPDWAPENVIDRIDLNFVFRQYGELYGMVYADDVFIAQGTEAPSAVKSENSLSPADLSLAQNYPNPFNPQTSITYSIDKSQQVKLSVYDLLGKEVAVLQNGKQAVGEHRVVFDASKLSSGIYIYRLETEQQTLSKRMVLMQ